MSETAGAKPKVQRVHKRLSSGMGRRRFLRTLVNAGFGVGMASLLSVEDFLAAGRDEIPLVYGIARDDPDDPTSIEPRTKRVPAEWYNELQYAFEVHTKLLDANVSGVIGSFVVPGEYGNQSTSIQVDVANDSVRKELTDLIRDIDFTINTLEDIPPDEEDEPAPNPHYAAAPDDKRVPGGVLCGSTDKQGTLAPAMYDERDGSPFFTTSNHLYGAGEANRREESFYLEQPDERIEIGTVHAGYPDFDFVRIRPTEGYQPASEIYGDGPSKVIGQLSKYGLADLLARGEPLEKFGAMTGHTTGKIKGIDGVTCYYGNVCKRGQLRWGKESTITDGDSGSVNYHPDPENPDEHVLVGGFNNARTWWPGGNYAWGTAAYHIYENHGYHF